MSASFAVGQAGFHPSDIQVTMTRLGSIGQRQGMGRVVRAMSAMQGEARRDEECE